MINSNFKFIGHCNQLSETEHGEIQALALRDDILYKRYIAFLCCLCTRSKLNLM